MFGQGPNNGFRVSPRRISEIRGVALQFRLFFGLEADWIDVEELLERAPLTVHIVEDWELPASVEACFHEPDLSIRLTNTTYSRVRAHDGRARFTVLHEFGHLVLGHSHGFNRDNSRQIKCYEDSEWQADQFAAEVLMPLHRIRELDLRDALPLARLFGVSPAAARTRLGRLAQRSER